MSNSETKQNQCAVCGQGIGESGIKEHLREFHADEVKKVEKSYGERMAESAFASVDQDSIVIDKGLRECQLCGEILKPGEDTSLLKEASIHLTKEHSETDKSPEDIVNGLYDDRSVDVEDILEPEAETNIDTNGTDTDSSDIAASTADDSVTSTESTSQRERETKKRQNASDNTSSTDRTRESDSSSSGSSNRSRIGTARGKYSVFGVGGAGDNILDAMLMRQNTLRSRNSRLSKAWKGGLQTYLPLNTNDSEIVGSYYQQEDQGLSKADVLNRCVIGDTPGGAGEDPAIGLQYMEEDIDNAPRTTIRSWPFNEGDVQQAQAIMFIHSVVKGTGSGATPALAEYIREDVLEEKHGQKGNTPMMGVTILPNEKATRFNPEATVNAGFGVGMMASRVNVLLPFDNQRLGDAANDISPKVEGLGNRNPAYSTVNRPLVQFLEAFMLSSNSEMIDEEATSQLGGSESGDNGFDVPDSYRPVANRYPLTSDEEIRPGVVAAPLMAVSESRNVDEVGLGILIESAFNQGLLVDCEPETAWGGTFIFYGPQEPMTDVSRHIRDFIAHEKITESLGNTEMRLRVNQAVVPEVDNLYMWGLLWNPRMPAMEEMFEKTKKAKERNNDLGKLLRNHWDEIRPVFSYLGRENRE